MIRHYLTFQRQAELLNEHFADWRFDSCWSQEKDRLYMRFVRGEENSFVEISLDLRFGYGLPLQEVHRARKNTFDLFSELAGRRLLEVALHDLERVMRFRFEGEDTLWVFFYGKGSGNVVRTKGTEVVDSFMNLGDEYDPVLKGEEDDEIIGREELIGKIRSSDKPLRMALSSALRRLGHPLIAEALWRVGLPEDVVTDTLNSGELERLLDQVDYLYEEGAVSPHFRLYHTESDVVFSLIELRHLESSGTVERIEEFDDLPRAVRACRSAWFRKKEFNRLQGELKKRLTKEEERTVKSLDHAENSIAHITRAEEWEGVGNTLLAFLHQVRKGESRVELDDWEGNRRVIKLDPKLSPAENADRYFRKARGARKEAEHSGRRAEELRERLNGLREAQRKLAASESVDELEMVRLEYGEMIGMKTKQREEKREERFRRFLVDGGYEVFAGKNAANNDELTLRFARPNDIWLHARGSSGSHVVLRWNDTEGRPPKRTLEEAAMIAAFYSGAKHSNLVPVAWTRKKYVRKPKGAAPGAVLVNREDVVMVRPQLPEGMRE